MTDWRVYEGDALAIMRDMPASSVDLILTDPPYFRVKDAWWDRQWDTAAGFISWVGELADEWRRVLRPNGSLYVFASPRMAARVEVAIGERFNVLNRITWDKSRLSGGGRHSQASKEALRTFFPASESIIFAEHYGADTYADGSAGWGAKCDELRGFVFEPLRAYLDGERRRAGVTPGECNAALGNQMAGHYFTRVQWALPTADNYAKMRELFNARANGSGPVLRREYEDLRREYEDLRREYEDLRREYEDLRREYEDLRRPFAVTANVPYTDVWEFPTVGAYRGKHPCEKPGALLRHIITTSSRPGAVVLDCFAGSGSTGREALALGRVPWLVEIDVAWAARCRDACAMVQPALIEAAA